MFLKQLKLINWQAHENLTLNFTQGVNFLYGRSGAGKSCIRRALAWVFSLDNYPENDLRKEGSKKTSVTVILDNNIEVERIKSATINRYVLRVPGKEPLEYDSIGKEAPQEIKDILQLRLIEIDEKNKLNLNFAEQISMPFLDELSGIEKFKLFNKICGNDLLDIIIQNFNKELLTINRELKNVKQIIEINEPQIKDIDEEITIKKNILSSFTKKLQELKKVWSTYNKLKEIQSKLEENKKNLFTVENSIKSLKFYDENHINTLKRNIESFLAINKAKNALFSYKSQLDHIEGQLSQIKAPKLNSVEIKAQINKVEKLKSLFKGINQQKEGLSTLNDALTKIKTPSFDCSEKQIYVQKLERLKNLEINLSMFRKNLEQVKTHLINVNNLIPQQEKEYKDILKESGTCPICKQETKNCEVHL